MHVQYVRDFGKYGDAVPIPDLIRLQTVAYKRFLQVEAAPSKRKPFGLGALLREVFPIESYAGNTKLSYLDYSLEPPRYSSDECRELGLTYGMPFRIRVRLQHKEIEEVQEESIYLGELPTMIGGGEFIINGSERVIVSQLHRSPGVDFSVDTASADRKLHNCWIIPERGSWIELNVTKKDILTVRIDQSGKFSAVTLLRALDESLSTDQDILRAFYPTKAVKKTKSQT